MSGCWSERARVSAAARVVVAAGAVLLAPSGNEHISISPAAAQEAAKSVTYALPAGPLSQTLTAYGQQSGIQVTFLAAVAAGKTSPGFSGQATPQQALDAILQGTGLSYSFPDATTVAISEPTENSAATIDGAIALDTISVSGGSGAEAAADSPYQSPGSVSHVSREQLDRISPISPGDVFISTPGVINAGNRVGTSLNPNIRGMQGMGRVNTTIDGARQNTSSYRGYIGNRDETYVDPDMVGGIDISKGPSVGAGVGGIGGSVNFRTLEAGDIVQDGDTTGTRIKTSMGTNTSAPPNAGTSVSSDRPGLFGDAFSGSFATAVLQESYEGIVAYSKRKQGNYFAGTKVPDGIQVGTGANVGAQIRPGQEVFNTSEDTESFLAKGKVKGEEQSLELSYLFYGSDAGQVMDLLMTTGFPNNQINLVYTRVDTYTAKYRYTPADNPYVNVRANLWMSDLVSSYYNPYGTRTVGGDIGNASVISTGIGELTFDNGAEFVREHATAEQFASTITGSNGWETYGPSGVRFMASAFSNVSLKPTDWLTLGGGLRYDHYSSEGEGYLAKFPDRSGSRVSPNANIVLEPTDGVQVYALYTEGYRPPSLRESHWHYQGLLVNNPNLAPEIAKNREVGVNILREDVVQDGDKLRFKASFFDNHYDDYIIRYLKPPAPGQAGNQYHWGNIDSATYQGFELSGGYDARRFFVEGAFTKYTKIEYCRTADTCAPPAMGTALGGSDAPTASDYVSNYVPPEYSGSVTVGLRAFDEKLTLGARTHFASVRAGSSWSTGSASRVGIDISWPRYTIFDVFGSYQLSDDALINFSVENITDEYYFGALSSVGIPSPGRTVRVGLTRNLDGDAIPTVPDLTLGRAAEGEPGSNWTGLYFGGNLGYGFAEFSGVTTAANGTPDAIAATESANFDLSNLTAGFQAGVNYQLANRVVVGVEGDFSWLKHSTIRKTLAAEIPEFAAGGWLMADTDYRLDWLASLRGRVGYAYDRYLIYGTGGVAFLKEDQVRTQYQPLNSTSAFRSTSELFRESASGMRVGWTGGAGFEYALTSNWSLRGEYRFTGFGIEKFLFPKARRGMTEDRREIIGYNPPVPLEPWPFPQIPDPRPPPQPTPIYETIPGTFGETNGRSAESELDMHSLSFGINYRF